MKIDVLVVPEDLLNKEKINKNANVVVIDVLRVCSTIVTALNNGAGRILPVLEVQEVFDNKKKLIDKGIPPEDILLCGERGGLPPKGFDMGNSPREYSGDKVKGKTIIISSTNGTKAVTRSKVASGILIGTFLNAKAVASYLFNDGKDVLFYLSGREGEFSLEDAVGAGMITDHLIKSGIDIELRDSALMSYILYEKYSGDLLSMFKKSVHGRYLESINLGEDLIYCARKDIFDIVPLVGDDGYLFPG